MAQYRLEVRQPKGEWQIVPVVSFFKRNDYNGQPTAHTEIATFESQGTIEVQVTAPVSKPITSFAVRPTKAFSGKQTGQAVTFTLNDTNRQAVFEINNDPNHPLVIATNPMDKKPPARGSGFQESANLWYFGPGYYNRGKIEVHNKSNLRIYLAPGAIVAGGFDFQNCSHVELSGGGMIFTPENAADGSLFIGNCADCRVRDVTIANAVDGWSGTIYGSQRIEMANIKIVGEVRDGVDVVNSHDITIRDSYLQSHDDAFIATTLDYWGGPALHQPLERVLLERTILNNTAGGKAFNVYTLDADIRDLTVRNCDIVHSLNNNPSDIPRVPAILDSPDPYPACAISIDLVYDGKQAKADPKRKRFIVENVLFDDVHIENCEDDWLINLRTNHPELPGEGEIRRITFRNVRRTGAPSRASKIAGGPVGWIRDIYFESFYENDKNVTQPAQGKILIGKNTKNILFGAKSPDKIRLPVLPNW